MDRSETSVGSASRIITMENPRGRTLILMGRSGDSEAVKTLFDLFSPMLENRSRVCGVANEDLRSEQALAFMKCLLHFSVQEAIYIEEFWDWQEEREKRERLLSLIKAVVFEFVIENNCFSLVLTAGAVLSYV